MAALMERQRTELMAATATVLVLAVAAATATRKSFLTTNFLRHLPSTQSRLSCLISIYIGLIITE